MTIFEHECEEAGCETCRIVVMRAYEGLRLVGQDDGSAQRAAIMVLSLRQPGLTKGECARIVLGWIDESRTTRLDMVFS